MRWFFRSFTEIVSKELITRCFLVHLCSSLFIPFTRYDSLSGSTVLRPSLKLHSHIFPSLTQLCLANFVAAWEPLWRVGLFEVLLWYQFGLLVCQIWNPQLWLFSSLSLLERLFEGMPILRQAQYITSTARLLPVLSLFDFVWQVTETRDAKGGFWL